MGSADGLDGSVVIHQDVELFAAILNRRRKVIHPLPVGRKGWLQVARGAVDLNGHALVTGDGAGIEGEPTLTVKAKADQTEVLVFDLP